MNVTPPNPPGKSRLERLARLGPLLLLAGVAVFLLIQLVPYRVRNNEVVSEPNWDSPRTQQLAAAACSNCHSNQTQRDWYTQVAPVSWWITTHVREGRAALNFSECTTNRENESSDAVREGSMPPRYYTWFGLHPGARLNQAERTELARGLAATARRGCVPPG